MGSPKKVITYGELINHKSANDFWIVVDGRVYDMTTFAPLHPGGFEIIFKYAACDASQTYADVHPPSLIIETLPASDQIGVFDTTTTPINWTSINDKEQTAQSSKAKVPLSTIINLQDFEDSARESLSEKNWAFISGASNDNLTRDANRNFFQKIWFKPRVMRNVKEVSSSAKMLGCNVSIPIIISPAGLGKTGGPEGEVALGRGAASTGIIQLISTHASYPLEDILKSAPDGYPFFFQLYVHKDRQKTIELLARINSQPQIKAIFVTVDLPVVSKREADERIRLEAVETSLLSGSQSSSDAKGAGLARSIGSLIDPSLCWDDIGWLRKHTKLPILLKGIQTAADAQIAQRLGCQGIMISNHGGRALDGAQPAILVLLELHLQCPEVFDTMEVYIDGGFRRGSDILKALCLGATGVGMGRPFMYALKYGREGVEHAVNIIQDEIATAMRLCGIRTIQDAEPSFLNTKELDILLQPGTHHPYAYKHSKVSSKSHL